jgi:hypothetical protein
MAAAHLGFPVASGAALPRSFPSVHIACRSRFRDPSFAASIPPIVLHLGLMPVVRLCLGDSALRFSKTICLEAATNRVLPRVCAWVLADRCSHVQSPLHLGVGAHRSRWGPGHRALFFSCSLIILYLYAQQIRYSYKKAGREGSKTRRCEPPKIKQTHIDVPHPRNPFPRNTVTQSNNAAKQFWLRTPNCRIVDDEAADMWEHE